MNDQFSGKTALVTGAASGIGQATALAFAKNGARVVVADLADASETLGKIKELGGESLYIKVDVSQEDEVKDMIKKTIDIFGSLDYAFNNAGIETGAVAIDKTDAEVFDQIMAVNLRGVFLCMKYQIPEMRKTGNAAIVNCASIAGLNGFAGLGAYAASKHGVVGLTKAAALENAKKGVRINAVCPGVIRTPMVERFTGGDPTLEASLIVGEPMGRLGLPEEIANTVIFLCSSDASFMTAQAVSVDGGWISA